MTSSAAPGPGPGFSPGWSTATNLAELGELTAAALSAEQTGASHAPREVCR